MAPTQKPEEPLFYCPLLIYGLSALLVSASFFQWSPVIRDRGPSFNLGVPQTRCHVVRAPSLRESLFALRGEGRSEARGCMRRSMED